MSSITLSDSRKLSYELGTSPENGPILLLSNTLSAPFRSWDHVVKILNNHGYRTLRYDQPGHGTTDVGEPLEELTFESMVDDVKALLDALNIPRLHGWVGDSMGAAASVVFATKYPGVVSRLAICDTIDCSPINAGAPNPFADRVAAARETGNMETAIGSTLERWFGHAWMGKHPDEALRMRNVMLTTTVDGFEACCHALASKTFDLRPLYPKVGASVDKAICIVGENDGDLPKTMKAMRDAIEQGFEACGKGQDVGFVVIEGSGHLPFIDNRDRFCEIIVQFMRE